MFKKLVFSHSQINIITISIFIILFNCLYIKSVARPCLIDHPLIKIQPPELDSRLLQSTSPHSLSMKGDYTHLSSWSDQNVVQIIKRLFVITKAYYAATIKVYGLTTSQSRYPTSSSCSTLGNSIPSEYYTGFDVNTYDMVIFFSSYVAAAAPCILSRWPLYGFIVFNSQYIDNDVTHQGIFHRNIQTVMHEVMHILALNPTYYNENFYTSFQSSNHKAYSDVIQTYNGRKTVVTSNVKSYVQSLFNCGQSNVGAILQDQGGDGTASAHWERSIYLDQLMTGSVWKSGLRITQLCLNLLKDTGFYYEIDLSKSFKSYFGKNLGCDFARGLITPSPQFCTGNKFECDFYSTYGGYCSAVRYSNNQEVIAPTQNEVCIIKQQQSISFNGQQFGPQSKCFNTFTGSQTVPHCFKADCDSSNNIKIYINSAQYQCNPGGYTNIPGGTLKCPASGQQSERFCSYLGCENYCDLKGVCINKQCIYALQSDLQSLTSNGVNLGLILGIAIPVAIIFIIILIICCICCIKKNQQQPKQVADQKYRDPVIVNNTNPYNNPYNGGSTGKINNSFTYGNNQPYFNQNMSSGQNLNYGNYHMR